MLDSIKNTIYSVMSDPFNRILTLVVVVLALYAYAFAPAPEPIIPQEDQNFTTTIYFFYHPACPHCKEQLSFNQEISNEFKNIKWKYYDVTTPEGSANYQKILKEKNSPYWQVITTPITVIGDSVIVGFGQKETPKKIRDAILELEQQKNETKQNNQTFQLKETIDVPIFGKINLKEQSLLTLSIVLGFVDGFNPCAMWILVYLISIALTLHDRKKYLLVIGTFLFAEGFIYFLIMTAWLNTFVFLGYTRIVMIAVGALAIWWGVNSLREFIKSKGKIECKLDNLEQKQQLKKEVAEILKSPLTLSTFLGIVILAFTVNSIEFACSSAIPVIFTQYLALQKLDIIQTYFYVFIYCILYMIDDILVFVLGFFAAGGTLGDRVASYSHLIGALVLIAIGSILLFAPNML
jgi:glutaredoxin